MLQILEKIILAGSGLVSLTKEKAEKLVDSLVEKGQLKSKDKKAMVAKLLKATKDIDKNIEAKMKNIALSVVKKSHKQIESLDKKMAKLEKELLKHKTKAKAKSNVRGGKNK